MALFGRSSGNEIAAIIKKLESRSYRGPGEKRQLVQQLAECELRADDLIRFLTGGDGDLARIAIDKLDSVRENHFSDRLVAAMPGASRTRWKAIVTAALRVDAVGAFDRAGKLMRQPNVEAREAGFEVIASSPRWKSQLSLVRVALRDHAPALRQRAAALLTSELGDDSIRLLVRDLMYDSDEAIRNLVIGAVARRPHEDFLEDFFDILPNVDSELQQTILRGLKSLLGRSGSISEEVLDRILPLLAAEDERIREAAAQLLATMPDKHHVLRRFCQYAKGIAFWLRDRAFAAVRAVATDLVDEILHLLADDDLDVVVGGIAMASECNDGKLIQGLSDLIRRDSLDWWVKVPAMERLVEFKDPGVQDVLASRLEDQELRAAALSCLGIRGEASALPLILPYLEHARRSTRRAAIRALKAYGTDARVMAALEKTARHDEDYECKMAALDVLDTFGADGVALAAAVRGDAVVIAKQDEATGQPVSLQMVNPELRSH